MEVFAEVGALLMEVEEKGKAVEVDTMEVRASLHGNSWKSMEVSGRQWK